MATPALTTTVNVLTAAPSWLDTEPDFMFRQPSDYSMTITPSPRSVLPLSRTGSLITDMDITTSSSPGNKSASLEFLHSRSKSPCDLP